MIGWIFPPIMQFEDNLGEMSKQASGEHLDDRWIEVKLVVISSPVRFKRLSQ